MEISIAICLLASLAAVSGQYNGNPFFGSFGGSGWGAGRPVSPRVSEECVDKQPAGLCNRYKQEGYCARGHQYYDWMERNCKLTCDLCQRGSNGRDQGGQGGWDQGGQGGWNQGGSSANLELTRPQNCPRQCRVLNCRYDEVESHELGECCPRCVQRPEIGCAPVYKQFVKDDIYMDGAVCETQGTIVASACFGVCGSMSVMDTTNGQELQRCQCCKAARTVRPSVPVRCRTRGGNPYTDVFEYDLITECRCSESDCRQQGQRVYAMSVSGGAGSSAGARGSASSDAAFDEFEDVQDILAEVNQ